MCLIVSSPFFARSSVWSSLTSSTGVALLFQVTIMYFTVGETIRPVRLDIDRRGYVLAIGETSAEALERAEEAVRLLRVEVE